MGQALGRRGLFLGLVVAAIALAPAADAKRKKKHRRHKKKPAATAVVRPPAARTLAKLTIDSTTEGAAVLVDGHIVGTVPLPGPLELEAGRHTIRVVKEGYLAFETTVDLAASGEASVEADLLPSVDATAASPPAGASATDSEGVAAAADPPTDEKPVGLHVGLEVGGGTADEAQTPATSFWTLGGAVDYTFDFGFSLGASFRDTSYGQTYWTASPPVSGDGPLSAVRQQEQLQDGRLFFTYDTLHEAHLDFVSLDVTLAPRFLNLYSDSFRAWSFAGEISTQLDLRPVPRFHIGGGAGFTVAFTGTQETLSVFGVPRYLVDGNLGVRWDLGDRQQTWSVELRWQAQSLVFERTSRFYHGAVLGLHFAI